MKDPNCKCQRLEDEDGKIFVYTANCELHKVKGRNGRIETKNES